MSEVNPSAARSKAWLVAALLELMNEKPYGQITISEIATRAQLSRRTFYRNFESKEALLAAHFHSLMDEYLIAVGPVVDHPLSDVVRVHLTFWAAHLDLLRALARGRMLFMLLERYNDQITELRARSGSSLHANLQRDEYALAFAAGGHLNVLFEWLRRGAIDSPDTVARAFDGFRMS